MNTEQNKEKYEAFREFYNNAEQREQSYIVTIQKLLIENAELKKRLKLGFAWK